MPEPMVEFTRSLWSGGDLVLSSSAIAEAEDVNACMVELRKLEIEYRRGLPGELPAMSWPSATWGLSSLYRACQFLVFRELGEAQLEAELGTPCPESATPSVCYSVDLSFRFLPDIVRMARAANANDPLVECLLVWANTWPLSSVGIAGVTAGSLDPFIDDDSLCLLYVDRILSTNDQSRLIDSRVRAAIQTTLGGFRELSPSIYDQIHQ